MTREVTQEMCTADGPAPGSVAEALRMTRAGLDYLNGRAGTGLDAASCGEVLTSLGQIGATFTAAHATVLSRFDAVNAHDCDGYVTSAAWLAAMAQMTRKDARAAVRQMRTLRRHPSLEEALARGEISASRAGQILAWVRDKRLPAQLRHDAGAVAGIVEILVRAAVSGATLADLEALLARVAAMWQAGHPDADGDRFEDRHVHLGSTFDGAGTLRGDLTPECAAAVQAVLEALGKKAGPEDTRSEGQRFHDALQLGCELLIRAKMVPGRAGADTQVTVHIPFPQLRGMPGASGIEEAFLRHRLGDPGFLTGKDAEAAACDALTIPVVTGHADMTVIDKIIALALAACGHAGRGADLDDADGPDGSRPGGSRPDGTPAQGLTSNPDGGRRADSRPPAARLSPRAAQALRYAIARLAIDFVSGPDGIAAALRTGLLQPPLNTPSLPLDIGHSATIPAHIRRAVTARDRHCQFPGGCDVPAAGCDVHHVTHQKDGGPTSVASCKLYCQFHHDVVIHRWGWQIIIHPDGTSEAHSPDSHTILHSHAPPTTRAG
jgi:hypothetical protein